MKEHDAMNLKRTNETPPRPTASEAEIRAMHDKAAAHQLEADRREAQAQHDLAAAEHMAAEMVANARAEANRIVREAQEQAAAYQRKADEDAKALRSVKATEEERARFWTVLASEEAARAGLVAVTETVTNLPTAEQNGAAQ